MRLPLADRNAGYAPQIIVLRDRQAVHEAATYWLDALLGFHGRERRWVLYDPTGDPGKTEVLPRVMEWNTVLRTRDVAEAQRWAALFVEATDLPRQEQVAADKGWLTVPVAPVRVTEWRCVLYAGRPFYAPLFNVSSLCVLPVGDVLAATGADCGCLTAEATGGGR